MQDEEGRYTGDARCRHWHGIKEITTRICCGGKKHEFLIVDCAAGQEVDAQEVCIKGVCAKFTKK